MPVKAKHPTRLLPKQLWEKPLLPKQVWENLLLPNVALTDGKIRTWSLKHGVQNGADLACFTLVGKVVGGTRIVDLA